MQRFKLFRMFLKKNFIYFKRAWNEAERKNKIIIWFATLYKYFAERITKIFRVEFEVFRRLLVCHLNLGIF